jgi:hypothetical protein
MRLYLDDDTADEALAKSLKKEGHEVQLPADIGVVGKPDPVHLTNAIEDGRALLTAPAQPDHGGAGASPRSLRRPAR